MSIFPAVTATGSSLASPSFPRAGVTYTHQPSASGCKSAALIQASAGWKPVPQQPRAPLFGVRQNDANSRSSSSSRGRPSVQRLKQEGRQARVAAMAGSGRTGQRANDVQVVLNGASSSDFGRAAIASLASARGLYLAGICDADVAVRGMDAGEVAGLSEPLEVPVVGDLIMLLASMAQSRKAAVLVDFTQSRVAMENARQAMAFGLPTVLVRPALEEDQVAALDEFCDKASMGCILANELNILSIVFSRAAQQLAFHSSHCAIVDTHSCSPADTSPLSPSSSALLLASQLSETGRIFNQGQHPVESMVAPDPSLSERRSTAASSEFTEVGDSGILLSTVGTSDADSPSRSLELRLAAQGQSLSLRHDIYSPAADMAGLLLAVRRVGRLKGLVVGLERLL